MKKNLLLLIFISIFCLSLVITPQNDVLANQKAKVSLPSFNVNLNGHDVDNQHRQYPLIVYKDITYFPMTWYDSRLLGLESNWSSKEGLQITKSQVTSSYQLYYTNQTNPKSDYAMIPTFNITLNGKKIDNSKETYPLLSFRNVTYFPLTWKFAHDELAWSYIWDPSTGLSIHSDNSQLQTLNLPKGAEKNNVAFLNGFYYFLERENNRNTVYRVPEHNLLSKELVYSYPSDDSTYFEFYIMNEELWFWYHVGGAVMGINVHVKVNKDGKALEKENGYYDFKNLQDGKLIVYHWVPPVANNMSFFPTNQDQEERKIGEPNLIYGWHVAVTGGMGSDNSTTVIGDDVYVMASPYPEQKNDLNRLYRVNLNTNKMEKIINTSITNFKIMNQKIYYVKDEDHCLYTAKLDGSDEKKLSDYKVDRYFISDNQLFYTSIKDGKPKLYKVEQAKEDTLLLRSPIKQVIMGNHQIICQLEDGEDYGVKVLDSSGKLSLAITDQVKTVYSYQDRIFIVTEDDNLIKMVKKTTH